MDPNQTWMDMIQAHQNKQLGLAKGHAHNLHQWLVNSGFPPKITGNTDTDRLIAASVADRLRK